MPPQAQRAKKFYSKAAAVPVEGGFALALDGRPVRTPGGRRLAVPTQALAEAIAREWQDQGDDIAPETMPLTRLANTALDRVGPDRAALIDQIASFGASDLLCYRATEPPALIARQAAVWDPWLDWAGARFGGRLTAGAGIVHVAQPEPVLQALRRELEAENDFRLAGIGNAAAITGSLVLALALAKGALDAAKAFAASCVDETFQAERWGEDAEAVARRAALAGELATVERFLRLL